MSRQKLLNVNKLPLDQLPSFQ